MHVPKYRAYRIATEKIDKERIQRGFFVKGQRADNLRWEHIKEFSSLDAAIIFAKMKANGKKIYGPDGCTIE